MRRQLVLVAAATTSMVVIAFVVPLALLVRTLAEERALTAAHDVAERLALHLADPDEEAIAAVLALAGVSQAGQVTVVLPDGRMVGTRDVDADSLALAQQGQSLEEATDDGIAVITPVAGPDGLSVVQVEVDHGRLRAGVAESWGVLGGLGLLLVVGAVVVADRLGRRITRPVTEVAAVARTLAAGDRQARTPVEGPPEIADVAVALNGLADHIESLLAAERESAADLSHRLRTPLTALRLDVEALPDTVATRRLEADVDRLEESIDRLIRHARAGTKAVPGADLAAVVRDRVNFWRPLAEDEGRVVTIDVPSRPIPLDVAEEDLAAAVDALVGNVLAHTPGGTAFAVEVREHAGAASLCVRDHGPGFESTGLVGRGRSGGGSTGLGLDICRRLAEESGGTFHVSAPAAGGALVELRFPLAVRR